MSNYADDVRIYDVGAQVDGRDAYGELRKACFPYFGSKISTERRDMRLYVGGDPAFAFGLTRLTGAQTDADAAKSWLRLTVCFRKVNGQWLVVHEHASLPLDCEVQKPIYVLDEQQSGGV